MANEDKKDFNAMLHDSKDMPKFQTITDQKSIEKYGGNKMYFAPPIDYDKVMKQIPHGKVITVGKIREYFAKLNGADFTEPITAGIFVSIAAWASYQRSEDETPYWRTLKANGELNAKYPGGVEAQKEKLEAEGHIIIQKGRKISDTMCRIMRTLYFIYHKYMLICTTPPAVTRWRCFLYRLSLSKYFFLCLGWFLCLPSA